MTTLYRPKMTRAGRAPAQPVRVVDEYGVAREMSVAGEFPLTIMVDGREVVTLMTLGISPEELALGYLRNQRLLERLEDIEAVSVDWERERVDVTTVSGEGVTDWEKKLTNRIVTTGCGQGTVFSCTLDKLYDQRLPRVRIWQSTLYGLLRSVNKHNELYKRAGAVHGCGLCLDSKVLMFVEDVGRHNAADAIAGRMWLDRIDGADKIFYTTGRLTSEIVMKCAHMGIPVLLSRSGVTHMGLELAQDLNVVMIARAKGKHFLIYNGEDQIVFDAVPTAPARSAATSRTASLPRS